MALLAGVPVVETQDLLNNLFHEFSTTSPKAATGSSISSTSEKNAVRRAKTLSQILL